MHVERSAAKPQQVGKPRLKPGIKTSLLGFKYPITDKKKFDKIASKLGFTSSELARIIVDSWLREYEKQN